MDGLQCCPLCQQTTADSSVPSSSRRPSTRKHCPDIFPAVDVCDRTSLGLSLLTRSFLKKQAIILYMQRWGFGWPKVLWWPIGSVAVRRWLCNQSKQKLWYIRTLTGKFLFSHWKSQWDCSKIEISMRSWARTSFRIKNLIKNLIENPEPHQEPHQTSKSWARPRWDSHWDSQWGFFSLMRFLILNEVFDEVLDFQWGSCPRPHLRSWF